MTESLDFTFLNKDQILGDDALEVMKRYGTKAAPTDLTVILGGCMTGEDNRTSEGDLTCAFWSASFEGTEVRTVGFKGNADQESSILRKTSARPALPQKEASKISPSEVRTIAGIRVAEYGEYPQTVADERTSEKLERLYGSKSLRPTLRNYTFDSFVRPRKYVPIYALDIRDFDISFKAESFSEYKMDGKRYIRVPGRPFNNNSRLSTGEQVEPGKPYWVEVQPIEWLMDPSGTMVAKKCLFAGIQFADMELYRRGLCNEGDFKKTSMKHYLDTYFAKEMQPLDRANMKRINKIKMQMLRTIAAENVSPEKGVVNPKRSDAEKQLIKTALASVGKGIGK